MGITIGHIIANNTVFPANDMTLFLFGDGAIVQQKYSGELTSQNLINLGLKSNNTTWIRQPTHVRIGNGVTSIRINAFARCSSLTSVTIGNNVESIGTYAFYGCSGLTSMTIPDSVTLISDSAFWDCTGLTSVTIGNGVTSIGEYVFRGCSGLTSMTIPNGVTSIDNSAFWDCTGLTSVTFLGKTMEQVRNIADGYGNKYYPWDLPSDCSIICTDGTITVT